MWQFMFPTKPAVIEAVGRQYKRKDETMTWELIAIDSTADTVKLRGPGYGKGFMTIDRSEFQKDWVAA